MDDIIHRKSESRRSQGPKGIRSAIALGTIFLCWGPNAGAEPLDLRNLNLAEYSYAQSEILSQRTDKYDANRVLLTRDPSARVVQFYKNMGLKESDGPEPGWGGVVEPGSTVFNKRMVAPHVPLYVTVFSVGGKTHGLDDRDLFFEFEMYVQTGKHRNDELQAVRERFGGLKDRFYKESPEDILKQCKAPMDDDLHQKEQSMEERGRHLQELAMQGRMEELREAMKEFSGEQQGISKEVTRDRWEEQIKCLEKLESESYSTKIELVATRDDVAGS